MHSMPRARLMSWWNGGRRCCRLFVVLSAARVAAEWPDQGRLELITIPDLLLARWRAAWRVAGCRGRERFLAAAGRATTLVDDAKK